MYLYCCRIQSFQENCDIFRCYGTQIYFQQSCIEEDISFGHGVSYVHWSKVILKKRFMIFSFLRNNCKSILNSLSICYHCNHFFLKAVTLGIICSTPLSFCNSLPQKHSYDLGLCDLTLPTVYYKSLFRAQAKCVWFFQVKQNLEHLTTQCHCILISIFSSSPSIQYL